MKIYFAYRSNYLINTRHVKLFEANSILEWFQAHWSILTDVESDAYEELLGVNVYGIPMSNFEEKIPIPKTISALKSAIEAYAYCEEVKANANCLQVLTDDDEIELAWFFFDENYANRYPEKISLWLNPILPTIYGNNGLPIKTKTTKVLPKGNHPGYVYYGSASIYDSCNFMDLPGLIRIEGVRLPQLLKYLRSNLIELASQEDDSTGIRELRFLQLLAKQMPMAEMEDILNQATKLPITSLNDSVKMDDLGSYSLADILQINTRNDPSKSMVRASEHLCEWSTNDIEEFQNYCVLFDDLWVEKNEALTQNMAQFFKKWSL